jgi:hypothetical protein
MTFKSDDLDHPRAWLRDVVQFTLDEFTADPLNIRRATTAVTVVYQYHERLFSYLRQTGKAASGSLEGFRAGLARACPSFQIVTEAAGGPASGPDGHMLTFSNIVSSGRIFTALGAEGISVHRAIILGKPKRQLLPVLEDVMAAYRRALDEHHL